MNMGGELHHVIPGPVQKYKSSKLQLSFTVWNC